MTRPLREIITIRFQKRRNREQIMRVKHFVQLIIIVIIAGSLIQLAGEEKTIPSKGKHEKNISIPSSVWPAGSFTTMEYREPYAYLVKGNTLMKWDLTDPANPVNLAQFQFDKAITSLDIKGSFAYVVLQQDAIGVVDISNPINETNTTSISFTQPAHCITTIDDFLYVGIGYSSNRMIQIFDISQPETPTISDTLIPNINPYAYSRFMQFLRIEDILYLSWEGGTFRDRLGGLFIIDITNPASPQILSEFSDFYSRPGRLSARGDTIFVTDVDFPVVNMMDISNPTQPVDAGHLQPLGFQLNDISIRDDYMYLADFAGLYIYNIADLNNPNEIFSLAGGNFQGVFPVDSMAYFMAPSYFDFTVKGLFTINMTDPVNPFLERHFSNLDKFNKVLQKSDFVFCASNDSMILLTAPRDSGPLELAIYEAQDVIKDLYEQDNLLYVSTGSAGIDVLDISILPNIQFVQNLAAVGNAQACKRNGDLLFVAAGEEGLIIYSLSDPANPVELSRYDTPGFSKTLSVKTDWVYLADGPNGLRIVDVSDPLNPIEIVHFETNGFVEDININGPLIYLADGLQGFKILDISDLSDIQIIAHLNTLGYAESIQRKTGTVFLADNSNGLLVIDVTDPTNPIVERTLLTESAKDLTLSEDRLFLADHSGLFIYEQDELTSLSRSNITDVPDDHQLMRNYPNPFNPQTQIRFTLSKRALVALEIFDVSGRLIYTLVQEYLQSGEHSFVWSGTNESGESVGSGIYFYRLKSQSFSKTQKMVLVR